MSTFHPFPRLPLELRLAIWELTLEPREVEVRIVKPKSSPELPWPSRWSEPDHWENVSRLKFEEAMGGPMPTKTRGDRRRKRKAWAKFQLENPPYHPYVHLTSSKIPALLHTCRDARNTGYKYWRQVCLDGEDQPPDDRRYVWLNLEVDMIHIGEWEMEYFLPLAALIKRLKLSRESPEAYVPNDLGLLSNFINAEEVHLVCLDGFIYWEGECDTVQWPCSNENLGFVEYVCPPWIPETDGSAIGYLDLKRVALEHWKTMMDPDQNSKFSYVHSGEHDEYANQGNLFETITEINRDIIAESIGASIYEQLF